MITKDEIIEIIKKETWFEVDSAKVYGIEEAAEKILHAMKNKLCLICGRPEYNHSQQGHNFKTNSAAQPT